VACRAHHDTSRDAGKGPLRLARGRDFLVAAWPVRRCRSRMDPMVWTVISVRKGFLRRNFQITVFSTYNQLSALHQYNQ